MKWGEERKDRRSIKENRVKRLERVLERKERERTRKILLFKGVKRELEDAKKEVMRQSNRHRNRYRGDLEGWKRRKWKIVIVKPRTEENRRKVL